MWVPAASGHCDASLLLTVRNARAPARIRKARLRYQGMEATLVRPCLHLRRCSLLVGAVMGLLLGAPMALAEDTTAASPPASDRSAKHFDPPTVTTGSKMLYEDSPTWAQAKLALWLAHGRYAYTLFSAQQPSHSHGTLTQQGATVVVGAEGCRVRIRIDRLD